jgi:hypothetical protein
MAKVLTAQAVVVCSHGGKVTARASQSKFKIGDQPVLVKGDLDGRTIGGCTNQPPPPGKKPCSTTSPVTAGVSQTLSVGDMPVLLDTATGPTDSVPPGIFTVQSAGQTKFDST